MYSCPTPEAAALTSWKREDISQTRQELGLCISQRCLSDRKKSLRSGVWVSACTMQFMKHVFPRLISPRRPGRKVTESRSPVHRAQPQAHLHDQSRSSTSQAAREEQERACLPIFNGPQNTPPLPPLKGAEAGRAQNSRSPWSTEFQEVGGKMVTPSLIGMSPLHEQL